MHAPSNPHAKDAEAAGRFCVEQIEGRRKWAKNSPVDFIYWLARWAGHWGNKALQDRAVDVDRRPSLQATDSTTPTTVRPDPSRWWVDSRNTNYYLCNSDGVIAGPFERTQKYFLRQIVEAHNAYRKVGESMGLSGNLHVHGETK